MESRAVFCKYDPGSDQGQVKMAVTPRQRSLETGHLFCFGLGFSGLTLAERLLSQGWQVSGTCRSAEKQQALEARGITAYLFDRDRPVADLGGKLRDVTDLLASIPPDDKGDPVVDLHGADIAKASHLTWIGYLSTTGVYGDCDGAWVDETSPMQPSGARGLKRLKAEQAWLGLPKPAHLFRLAGIYGPESSALDAVREGRARRVVKAGQVFSRIHVADIASVLAASMARPRAGAAYNVCDDDPAPPADVVTYACELLGITPPPVVDYAQAELSPMARSFYDDNKRVRNDRIKEELGVALAFPDYRVGLKSLFDAGF